MLVRGAERGSYGEEIPEGYNIVFEVRQHGMCTVYALLRTCSYMTGKNLINIPLF